MEPLIKEIPEIMTPSMVPATYIGVPPLPEIKTPSLNQVDAVLWKGVHNRQVPL